MKLDFKSPRLYLFSSMIAAVPAIPLQLAAYLTAYSNAETNYFFANSPLPTLATIFSILSCILATVSVFLWERDPISVPAPCGTLATFPAALGFLAGGTLFLLTNTQKMTYLLPAFCFMAAIYNIALIFTNKKHQTVAALIGFSAVIVCILFNGYFYFDSTLEMNAPLKVTVQLGFLAAMIYFISEIRALLGITLPRVYLLANACTVGFGALSSIPVTLAYLLQVFKPQASPFTASLTAQLFDHPEYLAGSVVLFGICISAAWRLFQALSDKEDA